MPMASMSKSVYLYATAEEKRIGLLGYRGMVVLSFICHRVPSKGFEKGIGGDLLSGRSMMDDPTHVIKRCMWTRADY